MSVARRGRGCGRAVPMGRLGCIRLAQRRLTFSPGPWASPEGSERVNGGCLALCLPPAKAGGVRALRSHCSFLAQS